MFAPKCALRVVAVASRAVILEACWRAGAWTILLSHDCLHVALPSTSYHSPIFPMNISGTLNVFRLIREPALCLPQHTVSTFNHLPVPLSKAFPKKDGEKEVDIKAVVLDKDNCFAIPHTNEVHKPYHVGVPQAAHISIELQFTCNQSPPGQHYPN